MRIIYTCIANVRAPLLTFYNLSRVSNYLRTFIISTVHIDTSMYFSQNFYAFMYRILNHFTAFVLWLDRLLKKTT